MKTAPVPVKFTGEVRLLFLAPPLFRAGGAEFLGLLEAVALGFDLDDLGSVDQAVDERDDASGVRKDLAPL